MIPEATLLSSESAFQFGQKGYLVLDHFLSIPEVEGIFSTLIDHTEEGHLQRAGIGHKNDYQINRKVRGDFIRWIHPESASLPVQNYLQKVKALISEINRQCYLGLKDFEVHFTWYPAGTFYKRHIDNFQKIGNRVVSFICYLNTNWQPGDGGELRIYGKDDSGYEISVDVAPTAGKLVLLLSEETEHEVVLTHKTRFSLTGWMLKQPQGLGFL